MNKRLVLSGICCVLLGSCLALGLGNGQISGSPDDIPLSTKSPEAKRAFQGGLENIENQQVSRAHLDFRSAVRADGNFALAHLFLAYDNGNPTEAKSELLKAKELSANASRPEQLMVQWLAGSRQGEMVPAISAMNDLVSSYPQNKFLLYLTGRWMVQQQNYEAAQNYLEKAIKVDPNYPAALNELAYAYAGTRNFDKAFEALDKYVKLLPGEPNTEDSYGEISRKAGRYEQALAHYNKALEYDSTFIWSQVGLADTYLLMGNEEKARAEYAKAIQKAPSVGDRMAWEIQSALTYFFAGQHEAADEAMHRVAEQANSLHVAQREAMAYRIMSAFDPKEAGFMEHSHAAEKALGAKSDISSSDRDEELALVLKVRAVRAAQFGRADTAAAALKSLADLAAKNPDAVVQQANEGAQGGVLWAQKKYAQAIPHLEEDEANPLSAARLILAYRGSGDNAHAEELTQRLNNSHEATIDEYLARRLLGEKPRKK